jgi:large subunit ribosomal protein L14
MIGLLTKVKIIDNSGAIEGRCIKVYGKKDKAYIGDTVLLSITGIAKGSQIKRGEKYKAIIVRIKKGEKARPFVTRWDENAVVLIKGDLTPIGSRIKGPISDLASPGSMDKILSIAGPLRI